MAGVTKPLATAHRLPTVSASQAFQEENLSGTRAVPLRLTAIDKLLRHHGVSEMSGGLTKGQVTEIYGPPGVGKTAFCMQACASALCAGEKVVWVDAAAKMYGPRLREVLAHMVRQDARSKSQDGQERSTRDHEIDEKLQGFVHYRVPSLAHFMALFVHSPQDFPPDRTGLVVFEGFGALLDAAYPRNTDARVARSGFGGQSSRRQTVAAETITGLNRLAAMRRFAALITTQTVTKIRRDGPALLRSAMSGLDWEGMISNRLLLFRDWSQCLQPGDKAVQKLQAARFASIVKTGGVAHGTNVSTVVAFTVGGCGVVELPAIRMLGPRTSAAMHADQVGGRKRSFSAMIGDNVGADEYGWAEEDDVLAAEGLVDEAALAVSSGMPAHHDEDGAPASAVVGDETLPQEDGG